MKVGELIIEARLDNKTLAQDLAKQKKSLIQYEKEAEKLAKQKSKIEIDLSEIETATKLFEQMRDEELSLANTEEERKDIMENYETILQIVNAGYEQTKSELNDVNNATQENLSNQEKTKKNIDDINAKLEQAKKIDDINGYAKEFGKSLERITKKVARWGLAIFGVRGAYMLLRNSMSVITAQDEQLKADIDYIKNAIAYALEPIVRKIVSLGEQLMRVVQTIYFMITGKNLFANANKNLAGANKQAKELKKQLAGFDEMNVLSDTSGGGESGGATPSFDLTAMGEAELPEWLKWLMAGLISAKIVGLISDLGLLGGAFSAFDKLLLGLGIAVFLYGVYETVKAIKEYIDDPSWGNFAKILEGIAIALTGVAIALVLISGPIALILMAIALVALLTATIIENWDKIKETFNKAKDWIDKKFIKPIKDKFDALPNWVQQLVRGIANTVIFMLNTLINGINLFLLPLRTAILVVGKVLGKKWSLQSVSIPKIPYLAKGGIINMPGRGVPVGSAIAGERGAEGVIPLTDSQQMALLGEAIGKYITVNANITNTMNGRVISRELQKVQNETNFAMNR